VHRRSARKLSRHCQRGQGRSGRRGCEPRHDRGGAARLAVLSRSPSRDLRTTHGAAAMTSSKELKARHDKVMFPCTANFYQEAIALKEGKGSRLVDFDGTSYLDFFGGILTVSVGHANERVNARVKQQIDRL